jgi:hypothetical protein
MEIWLPHVCSTEGKGEMWAVYAMYHRLELVTSVCPKGRVPGTSLATRAIRNDSCCIPLFYQLTQVSHIVR